MKPLLVKFKPSLTLSLLISVMSFMMCSIMLLLDFLWQWEVFGLLCVISASIYYISCDGLLLLPWSAVSVQVNVKNALQITYQNGRVVTDVVVAVDTVVTPVLTVIRYYEKDSGWLNRLFPRYIVILQDAIDSESFRELRVWLKWGCKAA